MVFNRMIYEKVLLINLKRIFATTKKKKKKSYMCYIKILGLETENDFGAYKSLYLVKVNSMYTCKVHYIERCIIRRHAHISHYLY